MIVITVIKYSTKYSFDNADSIIATKVMPPER